MRIPTSALVLTLTIAVCQAAVAQESIEPIVGIGPTGPLQVIHTGLKFSEGPAADANGVLYFTDVPASKILIANPGGEPKLFLDETQGTNGMMFDGRGRLFGCQARRSRIIAIDIKTKEIQPIAETFGGKKFCAPNDLVVDRAGGVYFTDPKTTRGDSMQDVAGVYYAAADGTVTRLSDDLPYPNGIILSPDEKTLYVMPFGGPNLMAYPIASPGKVGEPRVLCQTAPKPDGRRGGGDGMTVDSKGNLYVAAPAIKSIQVVSPQGETLGLFPLPQPPTNCTFGGPDMKTLYITARPEVYALEMEVAGHRFGASQ